MALITMFLAIRFLDSLGSQPVGRSALADPILLSVARKKSL